MTSPAPTIPVYPLSRDLRTWLARLQMVAARAAVRRGAPVDVAAQTATELVDALERELKAGDLIDTEPNVVLLEMRTGRVPEEFRRKT